MKKFIAPLLLTALWLPAQDANRISIPLSDPSRPGTVRVELMHGNITVRSYAGKEILVEANASERASRRPRRNSPPEVDGLKRIDIGNNLGLEIEERENVVTINAGIMNSRGGDVVVQVPQSTALRVKTMTGTVTIEGVHGEIEANSMNGQVKVQDAEGSVIAHSLNGSVVVSVNRVEQKPMSFSTMNGDIDVTLPADTKARLRIKNDHGEVYSDFEMQLEPTQKIESGRGNDGKYKVRFDRTMVGTINGGGPEISFTTLNGQIRIRQRK
jgi:hypothetical protein